MDRMREGGIERSSLWQDENNNNRSGRVVKVKDSSVSLRTYCYRIFFAVHQTQQDRRAIGKAPPVKLFPLSRSSQVGCRRGAGIFATSLAATEASPLPLPSPPSLERREPDEERHMGVDHHGPVEPGDPAPGLDSGRL